MDWYTTFRPPHEVTTPETCELLCTNGVRLNPTRLNRIGTYNQLVKCQTPCEENIADRLMSNYFYGTVRSLTDPQVYDVSHVGKSGYARYS